MLRTALIYGAISGSIIITVMTLGIAMSGGEGGASSQAFGYLVMIIALSLIFIGVKRYRDQQLGGVIKFWPAFGLGVSIAAVAGVFSTFSAGRPISPPPITLLPRNMQRR